MKNCLQHLVRSLVLSFSFTAIPNTISSCNSATANVTVVPYFPRNHFSGIEKMCKQIISEDNWLITQTTLNAQFVTTFVACKDTTVVGFIQYASNPENSATGLLMHFFIPPESHFKDILKILFEKQNNTPKNKGTPKSRTSRLLKT